MIKKRVSMCRSLCVAVEGSHSSSDFIRTLLTSRLIELFFLTRFLAHHRNRRTCMIWQYLQLCMKFLKVTTAPSLHTDRQEQGRHTQWKEERGKRTENFQVMPVLYQEQLNKYLKY
uniref:Uncharacterized protein n=1 Tax=Salix viminalis TaxID=40686 RepID=A0A6N2K5X2_SALVM